MRRTTRTRRMSQVTAGTWCKSPQSPVASHCWHLSQDTAGARHTSSHCWRSSQVTAGAYHKIPQAPAIQATADAAHKGTGTPVTRHLAIDELAHFILVGFWMQPVVGGPGPKMHWLARGHSRARPFQVPVASSSSARLPVEPRQSSEHVFVAVLGCCCPVVCLASPERAGLTDVPQEHQLEAIWWA